MHLFEYFKASNLHQFSETRHTLSYLALRDFALLLNFYRMRLITDGRLEDFLLNLPGLLQLSLSFDFSLLRLSLLPAAWTEESNSIVVLVLSKG